MIRAAVVWHSQTGDGALVEGDHAAVVEIEFVVNIKEQERLPQRGDHGAGALISSGRHRGPARSWPPSNYAGWHHLLEGEAWPDELSAVVLDTVRRAPRINNAAKVPKTAGFSNVCRPRTHDVVCWRGVFDYQGLGHRTLMGTGLLRVSA